jgi:hypothetical protein
MRSEVAVFGFLHWRFPEGPGSSSSSTQIRDEALASIPYFSTGVGALGIIDMLKYSL